MGKGKGEMRELNDYWATVGAEVIKAQKSLHHITERELKIAYLISDRNKTSGGKTVYADCAKVSDKDKWAVNYDFLVTVYPAGQALDDEKAHILMHHELLHIHPTADKTRGHDIDEFMEIADKYGLHWVEDTQ